MTFEGCEGVGKSSQMRMLRSYCDINGVNALFTREPGGSRVAEQIRGVILNPENTEMTFECEAILFAAARSQHLYDIIVPALKKGKTVFCDRYVDSSYAYQGFGRGLGLDYVKALNKFAVNDYMPDLTVFLDLPPEEAFKRKGGASQTDRMEKSKADFFCRIYEGYKEVARLQPHRVYIIDAAGTKSETHETVVAFLKSKGIL